MNTLEEQFGDWCRHFNGIQHETCKVGIAYKSVRDWKTLHIPCLKSQGCTNRCPHASFLSEEEITAKVKEANVAAAQYIQNLNNDICPHCKQPVEQKKQVGRCVYALPCWHRLYQGMLPKDEVQE